MRRWKGVALLVLGKPDPSVNSNSSSSDQQAAVCVDGNVLHGAQSTPEFGQSQASSATKRAPYMSLEGLKRLLGCRVDHRCRSGRYYHTMGHGL